MKQLFLVLLLVMFVSTSVFAEGLGVYAALQQVNSRTRTITNEVNISFLSSHDVEDDSTPDWLGPLLFGVGGTGTAIGGGYLLLGTLLRSGVGMVVSFLLMISGSIAGVSGFTALFESTF